jgi:hypothetical protein
LNADRAPQLKAVVRHLRNMFRHSLRLVRQDAGSLNPIGFTFTGVIFLLALFAIGFTACTTYDSIKNGSKATRVQAELESEYRVIQQLPEAKPKHYHASHKIQQALAGSEYQTSSSYPDIRTYYDSELQKHGWVFLREENVIYRGKYQGGKHAFYRKGEYTADIQYAGEQEPEFGWTYAFSLSWGLY